MFILGNTNAAVMMIAEKAGDLIKDDWPTNKHSIYETKDEL